MKTKVRKNNFNFTVKDFDRLSNELRKLFVNKGDRRNVLCGVHDYFPLGKDSYDTMLWIKALRDMNISNDPLVTHLASLELDKASQYDFDHLKDLIVYALFKWDYFEKHFKRTIQW